MFCINTFGSLEATIEDRVSKGYGIASQIMAIINDIPIGNYRVEIGLKLRQAMLINGVIFNSEGWHDVRDEHIKALEKVDESLLRSLLQSHAKTPLEFLFLETGSVPIRYLISPRRMLYYKTLIDRDDEEITKRISILNS